MYSVLRVDGSSFGYAEMVKNGCYMEFVCDAKADIATLPTGTENSGNARKPRPGSMAVCTDPASLYVLNNAREWVPFVEVNNA